MFILRAVKEDDLDDLFELSQMVKFINLPPDRDIIQNLISSSLKTFKSPDKKKSKNYYLFCLVNADDNKVVGASMIHGQHGTDEEPHFFLKVGQEQKYSETISTGFIHGTLKIDYEPNGYTEIGGLVLHPDLRGHKEKLGKQLSFVRFLYMAHNKSLFTSEIHSELMPPLDKDGNSPLWEAIGRRFTNMDYHDADVLSRRNKEFILSLYPSEVIYTTLLPVEARDAIGNVGKDTMPVKKMLESIGFKYTKEVDPFDGGPHYRAKLEEIDPVKNMFTGKVEFKKDIDQNITKDFLLKSNSSDEIFSAAKVHGCIKDGKLYINKPLESHGDLFDWNKDISGIYF